MASTTVPIIADVDILIIGGSSAAVACAVAAARSGARVLIAGSRPYLGDDICAHWRLWPQQTPTSGLGRQVFAQNSPSPMHIKRCLEQAVIGAGAELLLNCQSATVLRDDAGRLAGAVIANRLGLHAVRARQVVDASWRGLVARQAGAAFCPMPSSRQAVSRTLVGAPALDLPGVTATTIATIPIRGRDPQPVVRYDFLADLKDGSPAAMARAEIQARRDIWSPQQTMASEQLWYVPADSLCPGPRHCPTWLGPAQMPLDCLEVEAGLHLLSPSADLAREAVVELLAPPAFMAVGERLGKALAADHSQPGQGLHGGWNGTGSSRHKQVRFTGTDLRGAQHQGDGVEIDLAGLPVLGRYDVVVAGGGTAGAPAGIGAARAGASTLVIEQHYDLGGVGTIGLIGRYYHGNRVGFTAEVDAGVDDLQGFAAADHRGTWSVEAKQSWYLRQLDQAGADIWLRTATCGALVNDQRVCGVVVAGPDGLGLIEAGAVVDASGAADVAASAGAACVISGLDEPAVQGTGLSPRTPGVGYENSDHTFSDDSDLLDTSAALVAAKVTFRSHFDLAQLVDSRERRQIIGDVVLDPVDFLAGRRYPDSICLAKSNFDSHGFTIHPLFMALPPDTTGLEAYVPLRCLLPRELDGILVTGLAVSCQRDALPVIRMQPDVQNQGYAAGRIAALGADGQSLRDIDLRSVQRHLVEIGNLPDNVLDDDDNFPLSHDTVQAAIADACADHRSLAIVFSRPDEARPLLATALDQTTDSRTRCHLATVLGLLGDGHGGETLADALSDDGWDVGWNYRGMGQFGYSLSRIDAQLIALARSGHDRAAELLTRYADDLGADPELSHCRALALAVDHLPSPSRAGCMPALTRLLQVVGADSHAMPTILACQQHGTDAINENQVRNRSLRALYLARALWRCGEHDGCAATVLTAYANDVRAPLARQARMLLDEG